MIEHQADIPKIAMMPQNLDDVFNVLKVTNNKKEQYQCPMITMAMSKMGVMTRLCGEIFGSCLSFGSCVKASAPGQIQANDLVMILDILRQQEV